MASIGKFDKEFVERTIEIIENCKGDFEYSFTLLLNCMQGLNNLPVEKRSKGTEFERLYVEKIKEMKVLSLELDDDKTFRAVKNGFSHMRLEPVNNNGVFEAITINDVNTYQNDKRIHTSMTFTYNQLKEFALFVAKLHLERIDDLTR